MSTDDFFNEADVAELPIDNEGYKYDANYQEAYLKENPSAMVTIRSQNFEAIRGHDHMRLDANFAEFVIRKIMERTQKLL